jgi:hypothetical protein
MSSNTSRERNKVRFFPHLNLIGGADCDVHNPQKTVDLKVAGGAQIKKNMVVSGNVNIGRFIFGDLVGKLYTNTIQETDVGVGIKIIGDLNIEEDRFLIGDLKTTNITEHIQGHGICISNNLNVKNSDIILTNGVINIDGNKILGHRQNSIPSLINITNGTDNGTLGPITKIKENNGYATSDSTRLAISNLTDAISSLHNKLENILIVLRNHGLIEK